MGTATTPLVALWVDCWMKNTDSNTGWIMLHCTSHMWHRLLWTSTRSPWPWGLPRLADHSEETARIWGTHGGRPLGLASIDSVNHYQKNQPSSFVTPDIRLPWNSLPCHRFPSVPQSNFWSCVTPPDSPWLWTTPSATACHLESLWATPKGSTSQDSQAQQNFQQ